MIQNYFNKEMIQQNLIDWMLLNPSKKYNIEDIADLLSRMIIEVTNEMKYDYQPKSKKEHSLHNLNKSEKNKGVPLEREPLSKSKPKRKRIHKHK